MRRKPSARKHISPKRRNPVMNAAMSFLRCVVVLLLLAPGLAQAEEAATWTLEVENDLVADTDRHYTNGLRLTRISPADPKDSVLNDAKPLAQQFLLFPETAATDLRQQSWRWSGTFGQSMFTPADIRRRDPLTTDRPYAGWSYLGLGLYAETKHDGKLAVLDIAEVDIGIIGKASGAGYTQRRWHELIGADKPLGWSHQLRNEPGLVAVRERKWRFTPIAPVAGYGIDITPHLGGALGNVFTHAAAGATFRLGENLIDDYGPPRIRPSLPGSPFFESEDAFGWYLFAGFEGRAVARNAFLDGNGFQDGPRVSKRSFVGDVQFGLSMILAHTRISYTHVLRTREFDQQPNADRFGAFSLSWRLN